MPIETIFAPGKPTNIYIAIIEIAFLTCLTNIIAFEINDAANVLLENEKINKLTKHIINFFCQIIFYIIVFILALHLWGYNNDVVSSTPDISMFISIVICIILIGAIVLFLIYLNYLIEQNKKEQNKRTK